MLLLLVRIDFFVLIRNSFLFQSNPASLLDVSETQDIQYPFRNHILGQMDKTETSQKSEARRHQSGKLIPSRYRIRALVYLDAERLAWLPRQWHEGR